jgi:hypothetical protein
MKQGVDVEDVGEASDGEESTKLAKVSELKEFVSDVVKDDSSGCVIAGGKDSQIPFKAVENVELESISPIVEIESDPGKVATQVIEGNSREISPTIAVCKD